MGASCIKKCDGVERNSGNETGESKRAPATGGDGGLPEGVEALL